MSTEPVGFDLLATAIGPILLIWGLDMKVRTPFLCIVAVILTILFTPWPLWSWGRMGHRASAMLADSRLTPAAAAAIRDLLEPGEDLALISTWADRQREVLRTAPWHYVNVPITESRYHAKFCQPVGCVTSKIEDFRRALLDAKVTRTEKQRALKFMVHFLQDLHQPVHVGDNGDRGGNNLQLRFFDTGTNLHRMLDSQIIDRYGRDEALWAKELHALATAQKSMVWTQGSLADWATGSLEAAKLLYRLPGSQDALKPGMKLGEEYYQFALPIVRLQLARAGVRLAWVLNQIFN